MVRVLYGGTFDPVHNGHLAVARAARDAMGATVLLLPAADPPHRPAPGASADQRLALLHLAVADEPGLQVDAREVHRGGPSYSILTLLELRSELGNEVPLVFLLGADAFLHLHRWHRAEELFDLAHFLVVEREGSALGQLPAPMQAFCGHRRAEALATLAQSPSGRWCVLPMPSHPASATAIRTALARGDGSVHLPPAVAAHISSHGWYR